jgi:hypothetical protein
MSESLVPASLGKIFIKSVAIITNILTIFSIITFRDNLRIDIIFRTLQTNSQNLFVAEKTGHT